jgi:polyhydroxyalkanoate synthesis repressor PhaR
MASHKHLIKKYANRKLYDTLNSRYITLEGISDLVRDGHDIQVVDRDSGRDITALVLSQIVVGEEKRGDDGDGQDRGNVLLDYVRRTLSGPASLVQGEVGRRRSELEDLVDAAVDKALSRLSIATTRDIEQLSARIDELQKNSKSEARRASKDATTSGRKRTAAGAR